jgi:hypothetical protein
MKKAEFKRRFNLTENQFKGIDKAGNSLDLGNLTSIPEGFNPTVGNSLYLRNLTSIPEGFNPTVGNSLDLRNGLTAKATKLKGEVTWQNGKYILVDNIFTEVLHKKGNIYKVRKLNETKEFYLVTDGLNKWSHGDTIKDAKEDLIYKISNRSKDDFKHLTLDSVLKFKEAIECYRVITGACSFGTKDFIKSTALKNKSYKISEIIELTKNRYGNESFSNFFKLV